MSVQDIIKGAVTVQESIPGIKAAFSDTPSSLSQLPCFVTYPVKGSRDWPKKPNLRILTHDLDMDLYVQKGGDIQAADRILKPFLDTVFDTFDQNVTLGDVAFDSGVVDYQYGKLSFGDVDYLGIKFTLRAVEMKQVNYKK